MLETARGLSRDTLAQIAELESETVAADGGRLKLEWRTLESRSGQVVEDILWRDEDRLVGFVGLYAFGGSTIEVAGMVHPNSRRRGIGTRLLDAAMELCRASGESRLLLVAPRTSPAAAILATSRHGFLEHSEHALDLEGSVREGPSDPSLTLRAASRDDATALSELLTEAFGHPWVPMPLDTPDESALVAEREGSVIGTLRVARSPSEWGIYGFAVAPQFRGRGIGRDLLRRVCRQANEAGVRKLHLEVEVNNDRALGLYTSLGFTRTSTEDYFEIPL